MNNNINLKIYQYKVFHDFPNQVYLNEIGKNLIVPMVRSIDDWDCNLKLKHKVRYEIKRALGGYFFQNCLLMSLVVKDIMYIKNPLNHMIHI